MKLVLPWQQIACSDNLEATPPVHNGHTRVANLPLIGLPALRMRARRTQLLRDLHLPTIADSATVVIVNLCLTGDVMIKDEFCVRQVVFLARVTLTSLLCFMSNRRLYCNRQTFSEVSLPVSSSLLNSGLCLGARMVDSALHVRLAGGHVPSTFQFPCM